MIDREDLLGYLLGALDPDEMARVDRAIRQDRELADELRALQAALVPLESERDAYDPPPGLAERTIRMVETHRAVPRNLATKSSRFRHVDALATIASVGIIAMLVFPALLTSRFRAQVQQCQSNLLALGTQLMSYADAQPDRSYPALSQSGKLAFAGAPAVELREHGLLDQDTRILVCPGVRRDSSSWLGIPSRDELLAAEGAQLHQLQARAGGDYGWYLGVIDGGRFQAPRHRGRSFFVVASDAPSNNLSHLASPNHGGVGWNVLYDDMHVDFIKARDVEQCADDPLRNHLGLVAAGVGGNDSVVARSGTPVQIITTILWQIAPPLSR